jgi:hypothetical protein
MTPGGSVAPAPKRRWRTTAMVAGVLGVVGVLYVVLAWVGGPVPVPCGPRICGPLSHCVHEFGAGQPPPEGQGMPPDEYRCEPGLGGTRDAPRPAAQPAGR